MLYFYPERHVMSSNPQVVKEASEQAEARLGGHLAQLDAEIARLTDHDTPNAWMLGAQFSIVDAYLFTLCRWTRNFTTRPARSYPHLGPYLQRMLVRPSVQRVLATEQLAPPFV
jgi:glutathione S-transferase